MTTRKLDRGPSTATCIACSASSPAGAHNWDVIEFLSEWWWAAVISVTAFEPRCWYSLTVTLRQQKPDANGWCHFNEWRFHLLGLRCVTFEARREHSGAARRKHARIPLRWASCRIVDQWPSSAGTSKHRPGSGPTRRRDHPGPGSRPGRRRTLHPCEARERGVEAWDHIGTINDLPSMPWGCGAGNDRRGHHIGVFSGFTTSWLLFRISASSARRYRTDGTNRTATDLPTTRLCAGVVGDNRRAVGRSQLVNTGSGKLPVSDPRRVGEGEQGVIAATGAAIVMQGWNESCDVRRSASIVAWSGLLCLCTKW